MPVNRRASWLKAALPKDQIPRPYRPLTAAENRERKKYVPLHWVGAFGGSLWADVGPFFVLPDRLE